MASVTDMVSSVASKNSKTQLAGNGSSLWNQGNDDPGESGESGGGGGGGGSSSGNTDENATLNDTTTTNIVSDITNVSKYNPDETGISNIANNVRNTLDALKKQSDAKFTNSMNAINQNNAVANAQLLENNRNSDDNILRQIQKMQGVTRQLNASNGNGNYGTARDSLNNLMKIYKDTADGDVLNNARKIENEINQDKYSKNAGVITDYNESMLDTNSSILNIISDYLEQVGNLEGSTTTQKIDQKEKEIDSTRQTQTSNSTSSSSGGSSSVSTEQTSTSNIDKNTTGGTNTITNVSSNLNRYFNPDGSVNYAKLSSDLHIDLSQSGIDGKQIEPVKLQQRDHYRQTGDRAAALQRRYG